MTILKKSIAPILSATVTLVGLAPTVSQARIVRLEITETKPAFGGRSFGEVGAYERVIGKAYGEVDPALPSNAIIQDIALAPKNTKAWSSTPPTSTSCGLPIARKTNGVLFFNVINRGNKGGLCSSTPTFPGSCQYRQQQCADRGRRRLHAAARLHPGLVRLAAGRAAGNDRMTMQVPVARNPTARRSPALSATMIVSGADDDCCLSERLVYRPASKPYPTVSTDNKTPLADGFLPTLTVRVRENEPRIADPEHRMVVRLLRGRQAGRGERHKALLSGRFQAGPPLRVDLPRQGPAGARPGLCRRARPRRIPQDTGQG